MESEHNYKNDRALLQGDWKFIIGTTKPELMPVTSLPEIAFIGRSNVGKSSLINRIVNKKIARTSSTPGRTQQLNFFMLENKLIVVDLPGYGYADAPVQQVRKWFNATLEYLANRKNLTRLFVLVDSRRGIKLIDKEFMHTLDNLAISYQIIFTKSDLIKAKDFDNLVQQAKEIFLQYSGLVHEIILCSAKNGNGISDVRMKLISLMKMN